LGRPVKAQLKVNQKKGAGSHMSMSMNNMDFYDTTVNDPETYVNQLLHNCDDDVIKLAYAVVLGLDKTSSKTEKFAEGLTKAPIDSGLDMEGLKNNDDNYIDTNSKQIDGINDSLSLSSSNSPDHDIVFDDFFNFRSSLRTPIISLRDYAKSRQVLYINNDYYYYYYYYY